MDENSRGEKATPAPSIAMLSAGAGVVICQGGEIAYMEIEQDGDDFLLRYESGWYVSYRADGTRIRAGYLHGADGGCTELIGTNKRDVVGWYPCSWNDAREKYPWLQAGLHP